MAGWPVTHEHTRCLILPVSVQLHIAPIASIHPLINNYIITKLNLYEIIQ